MKKIFLVILLFYFYHNSFLFSFTTIEETDKIFTEKRDIEKLKNAVKIYEENVNKNPNNYEANWKMARIYCDIGGSEPFYKNNSHHKKYGELGIKYAEYAIKLNPNGIEGYYYYYYAISEYAHGISIIKALYKGIGKKFEFAVNKVLSMDPKFKNAAPLWALGRYYSMLPWPKKDRKKAHEFYEKALNLSPNCIKGHVFLAELFIDENKPNDAIKLLEKALKIEPDYTQEFSADYWKEEAKKLLKYNAKKLLEEISVES